MFVYMSFCDPDKPKGTQFLGACIVLCDTILDACTMAHIFGCNPGGEVQMVEIPKDKENIIKPEDTFKLFSRQEIESKWGIL